MSALVIHQEGEHIFLVTFYHRYIIVIQSLRDSMDTNPQVSVSWKEFDKCAGETLRSLLAEKELTDVSLACADNTLIKAHKLILSSSSPFFRTMFSKNSHSHPLVYMKGVEGRILEALLGFIYCGEAKVMEADINVFLDTAKEFKVRGLFDASTRLSEAKENDSNENGGEQTEKEVEPRNMQPVEKVKTNHAIIEGLTPRQKEKESINSLPSKSRKVKENIKEKEKLKDNESKQTVNCKICKKNFPHDRQILLKHKKYHKDQLQ